jgi:putative ABC transport system permease protein
VSSRLLQSVLFGITPTDLPTYAVVSALFGAIAVIACLLPTYRATTIDPTVALRTD